MTRKMCPRRPDRVRDSIHLAPRTDQPADTAETRESARFDGVGAGRRSRWPSYLPHSLMCSLRPIVQAGSSLLLALASGGFVAGAAAQPPIPALLDPDRAAVAGADVARRFFHLCE